VRDLLESIQLHTKHTFIHPKPQSRFGGGTHRLPGSNKSVVKDPESNKTTLRFCKKNHTFVLGGCLEVETDDVLPPQAHVPSDA